VPASVEPPPIRDFSAMHDADEINDAAVLPLPPRPEAFPDLGDTDEVPF
jgi:hypothetical protein